MTSEEIWNDEEPIEGRDEDHAFDIDVPAWIDQEISPSTVAAIVQGGCSSGAYMPAVTYYDAKETMNEHGDDVLQYLEDYSDGIPEIPRGESWAGIAVFFVSYAVELWASMAHDQLEQAA
jgi:hypothetical protein